MYVQQSDSVRANRQISIHFTLSFFLSVIPTSPLFHFALCFLQTTLETTKTHQSYCFITI